MVGYGGLGSSEGVCVKSKEADEEYLNYQCSS